MSHAEFIQYFNEFYGPKGLYPLPFKYTEADVRAGIQLRGSHFEGDTIDREAIRDILLVANNRFGGAFKIKSVD